MAQIVHRILVRLGIPWRSPERVTSSRRVRWQQNRRLCPRQRRCCLGGVLSQQPYLGYLIRHKQLSCVVSQIAAGAHPVAHQIDIAADCLARRDGIEFLPDAALKIGFKHCVLFSTFSAAPIIADTLRASERFNSHALSFIVSRFETSCAGRR